MDKQSVVKCLEDVSLPIWDGGDNMLSIKKGEKLYVTYHEFDGSLGLTPCGSTIEVLCMPSEVKKFEHVETERKPDEH